LRKTGLKKDRKELEVVRELYRIKFGLEVESDADEIAYQIGVISRDGARRVIRYAFDLAQRRRKKLTSVDKANVLTDIYGLWREVFTEEATSFPEVTTEFTFVDAITMWFVKNPEWFDVVVTPNMFGDIITDLGAMIQGGLGLAPGGNINPKGTSMFEPIHGSAPTRVGKHTANPLSMILSSKMMLEWLGDHYKDSKCIDVAKVMEDAVVKTLQKSRTVPDLGGIATTVEMAEAIAEEIIQSD
jgi:3-isopropylmalate dehydrogenase